MKNKNIVIVTTNFANGGTERRAMVLANGFADKGYKVTYLVMNKKYSDVVYKLDERIELVSLSDFAISDIALKEKELSQSQLEQKYKYLRKVHRIFKILKIDDLRIKCKKDMLMAVVPLRAFVMCNQKATFISFGINIFEKVYYASQGLDCKLIFSEINVPRFKKEEKEKRLFDKVYSKLLRKADACIFQTLDQKTCYGDCVKRNGYVVKNPITANLPPVYIGERKHKIVNFCRTHPMKNLILLVDAFKLFSAEFPDYSLEIYGSTSTQIAEQYKSEVNNHICDLGLESKAHIYEAVSDVHERIHDYGIFVSSSDYEGLSNSMLEAMALGLPCVCTDCDGGGAGETIVNGDNGLLVPVGDANAMYKALRRIAEDKDLEEKLSKNASKIRTELSVENIVNMWIDIIESR